MAISWLIACGIHAKMESDIQARLPASWTMPTDIKLVPLHSGFPQERDEKFQISWHENIFSRFVLQMLAHGL